MELSEVQDRYRRVREEMANEDVDVLVVSGSEYTGFDGAVAYMSGFNIVHRYAYVLVPREGDLAIVFPSEARYVGFHDAAWVDEKVFVDRPGDWLRERCAGAVRVGVYGLDYVMNVRDYRALAEGSYEVVPFDEAFDRARAVKSEAEMESVREAVNINEAGFWEVLRAYAPGKTEAEIIAPASARFVELGTGRHAMNMVLAHGPPGGARPEFVIPSETRRVAADDLLLYSLEIGGPTGHWAEVSRPIMAGEPSAVTAAMMGAYVEYGEIARAVMKDGSTAHDVHMAVSEAVPGPRLRPRPRDRALDRDDDDRAPARGGGERDRAAREHGLLHASARDCRGRILPLHAGDMADRQGLRRAAFQPAAEDLRRL